MLQPPSMHAATTLLSPPRCFVVAVIVARVLAPLPTYQHCNIYHRDLAGIQILYCTLPQYPPLDDDYSLEHRVVDMSGDVVVVLDIVAA